MAKKMSEDINEDYICGFCQHPVEDRILYCSEQCKDASDLLQLNVLKERSEAMKPTSKLIATLNSIDEHWGATDITKLIAILKTTIKQRNLAISEAVIAQTADEDLSHKEVVSEVNEWIEDDDLQLFAILSGEKL